MKKSDLKTGMIVTFGDGMRCIIQLGTADGDVMVETNGDTWLDLRNFDDDLKCTVINCAIRNIMKVEERGTICGPIKIIAKGGKEFAHLRTIWTRPTEKETQVLNTIAELQDQLEKAKKELKEIKEGK